LTGLYRFQKTPLVNGFLRKIMSIMKILNKIVGVDDVKQSIAWIGTVGLCLLVSVAIYVRVGQFTKVEQERDSKTEKILSLMMEGSGDGSRVNPVDVLTELKVMDARLEEHQQITKENNELLKALAIKIKGEP